MQIAGQLRKMRVLRDIMKTRIVTMVCVLAFLLAGVRSSLASDRSDPAIVATDAIIVRPVCFVATLIGSVFFVVALPVAATSGTVHRTADVLVAGPARATFTRP